MPSVRHSAFLASPQFAYVYAVLPPLFWSGNFLIARIMRHDIPPIQMSFWRWTVAFAFLIPFAAAQFRGQGAQIRKELPFLLVLGAVGITAFNCFLYSAMHYTTVVNASLINSLMPVMCFLFALLLLHERLRLHQVAGVIAAFLGAALIVARGDVTTLTALALNQGDLLVMGGLTFWAVYTVLIRWRPTKLPILVFLATTIAMGAVFHLPLVAWEASQVGGFTLNAASAASILYFAIFSSLLAYVLWNKAVAAIGPGRTGMYMYLMPVFGAVLGVGLLGEPFLAYHLAGITMIFVGITLVNRAPRPR
jgi:drug/metabolite transporter (DMT)-like permease